MTSIQDAAEQQERRDPAAVVALHRGELAQVMPRQLQDAAAADVWFSAAIARLRSSEKLRTAAMADVSAFMGAMAEAARLGLVPGTEQYYLTVRSGKIQGIVGYQGVVELMYRSGTVHAVICDVVRRSDQFYIDQVHREVQHQPADGLTWFDETERGPVIGAYAFAVMADGTTSHIVRIGNERIARARAASAAGDKGPWATDYAAMVRKTALHDLEKWVPTSSDDVRLLAQLAAPVAAQQAVYHQITTVEAPAIEAAASDADAA